MTSAQIAAVLTWVYAAGFGVPAVPVAVHLLRNGSLPTFLGLFPMYGDPWFARVDHRTFGVGRAVLLALAWRSLE